MTSITTSEVLSDIKFKDDIFYNLRDFGEQIISILDDAKNISKKPLYNINDKGFSLAIDSGWGTGKTTFLIRLYNELNETTEYRAIYYNAWDNDDFEQAIVPLIYNIRTLLDKEDSLEDSIKVLTRFFNGARTLGYYLGKILKNLPLSLKLNLTNLQIGTEIKPYELLEALKNAVNGKDIWLDDEIYNDFISYSEAKSNFLNALRNSKTLKSKKLVIIIDELDRCRPTFAIETLEVVKHFFDIENIFFVFAMDFNQLSHSISGTYGTGIDSPGYLRRFFDIQICFPPIEISSFIKLQLYHCNIVSEKIFKVASNLRKNEIEELDNNSLLVENLCLISNALKLSLRDIEKFISYLLLLCRISFADREVNSNKQVAEVLSNYYYLIILTLKYPKFWRLLIDNKFDITSIEQFHKEIIAAETIIPAKYFFEESIKPNSLANFCRQVLFPYSILNSPVSKMKDSQGKVRPNYIKSLFLNQNDGEPTVLESIRKNLSVIPFISRDDELENVNLL